MKKLFGLYHDFTFFQKIYFKLILRKKLYKIEINDTAGFVKMRRLMMINLKDEIKETDYILYSTIDLKKFEALLLMNTIEYIYYFYNLEHVMALELLR